MPLASPAAGYITGQILSVDGGSSTTAPAPRTRDQIVTAARKFSARGATRPRPSARSRSRQAYRLT